MEEKNNKGLIIGLIIFLVICLIAIFYFMFKMVYKEPTNNNSNETSNTETNSNEEDNSVVFTELTKYTLLEGKEQEITVDGKKIVIKKEINKIYFNNQEINKSYSTVYITNHVILLAEIYQFGEHYDIYDFDGNKIEVKENSDGQYENIRISNNRLLVDNAWVINGEPLFAIGNLYPLSCSNENAKDITSYLEVLEEHQNDILNMTYEIKYTNNEIIIAKAEDIDTIGKWIETFNKVCVIENNN